MYPNVDSFLLQKSFLLSASPFCHSFTTRTKKHMAYRGDDGMDVDDGSAPPLPSSTSSSSLRDDNDAVLQMLDHVHDDGFVVHIDAPVEPRMVRRGAMGAPPRFLPTFDTPMDDAHMPDDTIYTIGYAGESEMALATASGFHYEAARPLIMGYCYPMMDTDAAQIIVARIERRDVMDDDYKKDAAALHGEREPWPFRLRVVDEFVAGNAKIHLATGESEHVLATACGLRFERTRPLVLGTCFMLDHEGARRTIARIERREEDDPDVMETMASRARRMKLEYADAQQMVATVLARDDVNDRVKVRAKEWLARRPTQPTKPSPFRLRFVDQSTAAIEAHLMKNAKRAPKNVHQQPTIVPGVAAEITRITRARAEHYAGMDDTRELVVPFDMPVPGAATFAVDPAHPTWHDAMWIVLSWLVNPELEETLTSYHCELLQWLVAQTALADLMRFEVPCLVANVFVQCVSSCRLKAGAAFMGAQARSRLTTTCSRCMSFINMSG